MDVQHVVLDYFSFNRKLLEKIPEEIARQYRVIPLFEEDGAVTIAMADPTNQRTMNYLKFKIGKEVEPVIATEKSIINAIEKNYVPDLEQITELLNAEKIEELDVIREEEVEVEHLTETGGAQVIKLVNLIVSQAVTEHASDIHIEPMNTYLRLRYRIDGELIEKQQIPLHLHAQIVSRLKIMAGMDIAERRKPQDGHIQVRHLKTILSTDVMGNLNGISDPVQRNKVFVERIKAEHNRNVECIQQFEKIGRLFL